MMELENYHAFHFVGLGGVGMCALARILIEKVLLFLVLMCRIQLFYRNLGIKELPSLLGISGKI